MAVVWGSGRFSTRRQFTLEPLRTEGAEALIAPPGCGIDRIVLRALEGYAKDEDGKQWSWKAEEQLDVSAVPAGGRLLRAGFDLYFTGQRRPRGVQLRAGNQLRMSRHCDATAVHRWLTERGFRTFHHGWTRMNTDEV